MAGGLVAADEEEQGLVDDGLVVEAVAVDLRLAQRADQPGLRTAPTLPDDAELEVAERQGGEHPGLHHLLRRVGVGGAEHLVGPAEEVVVQRRIEAEQVGDDEQRERCGHVPYEVALPLLAHVVDDAPAGVGDQRFEVADGPGREAAVHERTAPPVLGVVHRDHRAEGRHVGSGSLGAGEHRRVLLDGQHVGVAGDAPHPGPLVPVDGCLATHPVPDLVRVVRVPTAVEEVEAVADGVRRRAGAHPTFPTGVRASPGDLAERLLPVERRLPGQAEHLLADGVALHLDRAPGDGHEAAVEEAKRGATW